MARTATHRQPRSGCPISIALELLGDAWSLLIVRDLMFKDRRTYNDFLMGGESWNTLTHVLVPTLPTGRIRIITETETGAIGFFRIGGADTTLGRADGLRGFSLFFAIQMDMPR